MARQWAVACRRLHAHVRTAGAREDIRRTRLRFVDCEWNAVSRSQVKQGPVVYVLGEGRGGLKNRIAAWLRERDVEDVSDVFFVLAPVHFHRTEDVAALRAEIEAVHIKPVMVVIDTFARCAVGIDQNDATAMDQWIDAIRELQEQMKVDVLALHHSTENRRP
jgi:hypothetical protein